MLRDHLREGFSYHIFNKSISNYQIFDKKSSHRFLQILSYYNNINPQIKLSYYLESPGVILDTNILIPKHYQIIKFISYSIMPNHYHLQVKILNDNLIHHLLNNIGNAYTRYFNLKHKRKGPLWQSPYHAVLVKTDMQQLHLSRYINLNATTAGLVNKPEDWEFSSYRDYVNNEIILKEIMTEITIKDQKKYKKFVEDRKDYQIKLGLIKKQLLE